MKTLDYIKLNPGKAGEIVKELNQLLADLQVYYTNLRGFHWNLKGKGFLLLHSRLEEMYDDVAEKVDEVAERMLMLGSDAENKFSEYLKISKIKEISGVHCGNDALKNILDMLKVIMDQERKILSLASDCEDEVTVAIMGDYLKSQEKEVWMLVASMQTSCSE